MYRLIIADDEESIRNGIAHSLPWREWGYEVCALCSDGQEVLEQLKLVHPDVVLSDIRMPGMDGVELMQRLSSAYPDVKIVILSGYSDFEYLNMSIKNHVAEYLLKPTDFEDFEETFLRLKNTLDKERLQTARVSESVQRHFQLWLTSLLEGTAFPQESERFLPMLTAQGIDTDNLVVAAFTLDGHGGDEKTDLLELWRSIWKISSQLPAGKLHQLPFLFGGERLLILYSSESEIQMDDVTAQIRQLQNAVRTQLRTTLSAGISSLCTELEMLPQAYEQANCCAKQSAFSGRESVFHFQQIQNAQPKVPLYFDTEKIEKSLLAQDYDTLRTEIDRVLLLPGTAQLDYQTVDRLCLSLLFHVSLWSLRYGVQMEEVLRTLGAHYTDIHQCGTLTSKRDFVLACLFACQQALAHRRNHGRTVNSVAQRVREYVDSEYASHMISLESVAASVHKTPAYISRVFKNELGCNFSDYLTEKRMRRAAELLKEPDDKVYLIAQQCGYADTSNFIRVFKKYYGISPVEYRAAQGGAE